MALLFSIFFWLFSFLFMALLAFGTLIVIPFFTYPKVHRYIPAPGFALIAKLATLGRLKIVYDPKFDPKRQSVFCMNHTNLIDAHVASAAIPHAFCGLMNAWQFKIPFYGWLMKHSKGIAVNKKEVGKILEKMIYDAKERKKIGMSILVFPEAHRTPNGKIERFRKGVFFMARDAGYPIVPMVAKGMYEVNHKGSYLFRPHPVTVYVGPQLETAGVSDDKIDTLVHQTYEFMEAHVR